MLPNSVRQKIRATQIIDLGLSPGDSSLRTLALDAVIEQAKIDHPECFLSEGDSSNIARKRKYRHK